MTQADEMKMVRKERRGDMGDRETGRQGDREIREIRGNGVGGCACFRYVRVYLSPCFLTSHHD
jgi:hypothetical protein